jgi:hypothetical protein
MTAIGAAPKARDQPEKSDYALARRAWLAMAGVYSRARREEQHFAVTVDGRRR